MRRNTIKWRIFKYNLIVIIVLIALTTIIFNIAVRLYIENDITKQLSTIASRAEDTALRRGEDFFPPPGGKSPPPPRFRNNDSQRSFHMMIDRSLKETLSVLNADYILLNSNKEVLPSPDEFIKPSDEILKTVTDEIGKLKDANTEKYINFNISGKSYTAVIRPVIGKNSFGLGWLIIYSNIQKVNQLQWAINVILLVILLLSSMVMAVLSSIVAKKISSPFSSLNKHIGAIADRRFGSKIHMPVYDELQEFVNNINIMSEKLEKHDMAQKTFLQNVSHEFRTPLMSIQSYAEGIKYDVVDTSTATDVIIDETKRMTHLVEDLLYLSRLDAIEESYHFESLEFDGIVNNCIDRINRIADSNKITITMDLSCNDANIYADEEKLSRAVTNILSNCVRYAKSKIKVSSKVVEKRVELVISDDGPGFDENEIESVFERFYKGKKGKFGLGLAITKSVIEKHNGIIAAENSGEGAVFIIKLPLSSKEFQ